MGRNTLKGKLWKDYTDAGHEVLIEKTGPSKCHKCQAEFIDLAEDLFYGPMRKCNK